MRTTDHGTHAIGADKQVALSCAAVGHLQGHASARHGESCDVASKRDGCLCQRLRAVRHEAPAAAPRPSGLPVLRGATPRASGRCHRAGAAPRVVARTLSLRTASATSSFPQRGDRIRRKAHSEAELTRGRCPFEDADVPPGSPQGQAGGETADTGADDQGSASQRQVDARLNLTSLRASNSTDILLTGSISS